MYKQNRPSWKVSIQIFCVLPYTKDKIWFCRLPWQKSRGGIAVTPDEGIYQLLSRSYADVYPDMYKPDICKASRSNGIFHGADFGTGSSGVLDEVYTTYHSYMVRISQIYFCTI